MGLRMLVKTVPAARIELLIVLNGQLPVNARKILVTCSKVAPLAAMYVQIQYKKVLEEKRVLIW